MSITFSIVHYIRSITVLIGTVMLLSCQSNDPRQVSEILATEEVPDMVGYELVMTYSDSARIQYKMTTPEYLQFTKGKDKYEEFPKGIHIVYYNKAGNEIGSIKAKYAKKLEASMLWEARDEVVVVNLEGKKLETEQLFWDMKKEMIYSERYAKFTDINGQILEGNDGFTSDQSMSDPVLHNVTGELEVEKNNP